MFEGTSGIVLISALSSLVAVALLMTVQQVLNWRRNRILGRLRGIRAVHHQEEEDILQRPFLDRTVGVLAQSLKRGIGNITPKGLLARVEQQIEKAGNPRGMKATDLLALQSIAGATALFGGWFLLTMLRFPSSGVLLLAPTLGVLAAYLPWFSLASRVTRRQREIRRHLPDIMDLIVVSVEAGLAFDMALLKVVERFRGTVAHEFQRALREMQLGRPRKDALRSMAERVNLPELSALVNAILQTDQLGVGLGGILRMQADLMREKRQQLIEEQAMKAPVKMLFPMVIFIFPSIFIVILGPAVLSIVKVLGGK